jgi:hypothetical protein
MSIVKTNIKGLALLIGAAIFTVAFFFLSNSTFAAPPALAGNVFNGLLTPGGTVEYGVWSSTTGWISLNNCTDGSATDCTQIPYGVNFNETTGVLSGSAWSSNVGWITFDEYAGSDIGYAGCPGGAQALPKLSTGDLFKGFARVTVADPNSSFWDGCISLSYLNEANPAAQYGVKYLTATQELVGQAWGGEVLGWISFHANMDEDVVINLPPTATLYVSGPNPINPGTSTELTWSTSNVTNCAPTTPNGDPGWVQSPNPVIPASGGTFNTANLNQDTIYKMVCDPVDTVNYTSFTVDTEVFVSQFSISLSSDDNVANLNSQAEYEDDLTWTAPANYSSCALNEVTQTGQVLGAAQIITGGTPAPTSVVANALQAATVSLTDDPTYYKVTCSGAESNVIMVTKDPINPSATLNGPACVPESQPSSGWIEWQIDDILDINPSACTLTFDPVGGSILTTQSLTPYDVYAGIGEGTYSLTCDNPLGGTINPPAVTIQELPDAQCVYVPPPTTTDPQIIFIEI